MKKQKRFSQKGITLVALVITIIILLILAGITIASLTGSGLFENARLAKEKSDEAQEKENSILADYENKIGEYISQTKKDEPTQEQLLAKENIKSYLGIEDSDALNWVQCLDESSLDGVSDSELLDELMNSQKAVEYMITNEDIIKTISENEVAMESAAKSNYAFYKIMTTTSVRTEISESEYIDIFDTYAVTVPIGTQENIIDSGDYYSEAYYPLYAFDDWSNNTYYNSANDYQVPKYIGYNFNKNLIIYKVKADGRSDVKHNPMLQGGDSSGNWTDIASILLDHTSGVQEYNVSSNTPFSQFRLYYSDVSQLTEGYGGSAIQVLQFYCVEAP